MKRVAESDVTVLEVSGTVKLGESARQFAAELQDLLDNLPGGVVVDLEAIDYVDSTGIGELVGYLQKFSRAGRRMALLRPQPRIQGLLKLTRLDNIFPIFQERQAALDFAGARA